MHISGLGGRTNGKNRLTQIPTGSVSSSPGGGIIEVKPGPNSCRPKTARSDVDRPATIAENNLGNDLINVMSRNGGLSGTYESELLK